PGRPRPGDRPAQKVSTEQVWPERPPPTELRTPAFVGGGEFVVPVRAPAIRFAEIVVRPRFALAVTAPLTWLPASVTPARLASSVTAPSIVLDGQNSKPSRPAPPISTGPEPPVAEIAPRTVWLAQK